MTIMTIRKKHPDIEYRPLYEQIEDSILKQLGRRFKVGESIPTMAEMAEAYGVDLITIKRALMELSSKGYLSSGRGRRAQVLKEPERGRTALLVELDYTHESCSPHYRFLVDGILCGLEGLGIDYRLYKGTLRKGERPERLTARDFEADLEAGRIGGIIALGTDPTLDFHRRARELGVPLLGTVGAYEHAVTFNRLGGIDLGLSMLAARGSRNIAAVGWKGYHNEHQHTSGYFEWALRRYGMSFRPYWFRSDIHPLINGAGWEGFFDIWVGQKDKPDSLFVLDDTLLPDVLQALRDIGLSAGRTFPVCCNTTDHISGDLLKEGEEVICLHGSNSQMAGVIVSAYRRILEGEFVGHMKIPSKTGILTPDGLIEAHGADVAAMEREPQR